MELSYESLKMSEKQIYIANICDEWLKDALCFNESIPLCSFFLEVIPAELFGPLYPKHRAIANLCILNAMNLMIANYGATDWKRWFHYDKVLNRRRESRSYQLYIDTVEKPWTVTVWPEIRVVIGVVPSTIVWGRVVVVPITLVSIPICVRIRPIVGIRYIITVVIASREQTTIVQRTEVIVLVRPIRITNWIVPPWIVSIRPVTSVTPIWVIVRPIRAPNVRSQVRHRVCSRY